jgi:hypothetical protein
MKTTLERMKTRMLVLESVVRILGVGLAAQIQEVGSIERMWEVDSIERILEADSIEQSLELGLAGRTPDADSIGRHLGHGLIVQILALDLTEPMGGYTRTLGAASIAKMQASSSTGPLLVCTLVVGHTREYVMGNRCPGPRLEARTPDGAEIVMLQLDSGTE